MSTFDLNTVDEFLLRQIIKKLSFRSGANFYRSCRGAKELVDAVKPAWLPPDQRYHILLHYLPDHLVLMDMKTFDWKRLSIAMPYETYSPGVVVYLNGELYVFGGRDRSNILKVAYKLKKNLEWERLPDMIIGRYNNSKSSVIFNGCIWVMGGWRRPFRESSSVEAYDPTSNTWIAKPRMNRKRESSAAAVVNGKIFVCGGYKGIRPIATVEYYDAELSRWIDCQPLPWLSACSTGLVYGSYLIAIDSYCPELRKHNGDVWCMDFGEANPRWRNLPSVRESPSRTMWLTCAATVGGKLVVVRPRFLNNNDGILSVEIFDGKTWSSGPDLPGLNQYFLSTSVSDEFAEKLLES